MILSNPPLSSIVRSMKWTQIVSFLGVEHEGVDGLCDSFNKQNDGAYVMKGRTYLKHPWFVFCIDNKR